MPITHTFIIRLETELIQQQGRNLELQNSSRIRATQEVVVIMVIGNPYNIAVFYEEIKDWNENSEFTNGVLLLFIDGNIFPNEILNVTLGFDLKKLSTKLETIPTNKELFKCEMKDCFSKIYNLVYPEDWDEDGDDGYLISPPTYRDYGYYVFAVGDGQKTRFLYAKLKYIMKESQHDLEHAKIREIVVDDDKVKKIASDLRKAGYC